MTPDSRRLSLSVVACKPHLDEAEVTGAAFQKRARIIQIATKAFFTHGYEHASLQEIAEEAGVGKVTIYRYFIDKADLFTAVVLQTARHLSDPLRNILRADTDVRDNLIAFTVSYTERMLSPICEGHCSYEFLRILLPQTLNDPEISWRCRDILRDNLYRPLLEYFSRLVEDGTFRIEDPIFLAKSFIHIAFFIDYANFDADEAPGCDEVEMNAARVADLFLGGVRNR